VNPAQGAEKNFIHEATLNFTKEAAGARASFVSLRVASWINFFGAAALTLTPN
jgi:hypothetical protein